MLIRNTMTSTVITVTPEMSMFKASKLMREHTIRRLPVVDAHNRVVGIVSDRDIKSASPSKATTLDMHELYYLLSELKIKDIMTPNPVTIGPLATVESAAMIMEEAGFGGLPVVDDTGVLVGIITDTDVFKVLISITGARQGGVQLAFLLPDKQGTIRPILDALREHQASIVSILTSVDTENPEMRRVYVRIRPMNPEAEQAVVAALRVQHNLLYWARNSVHMV